VTQADETPDSPLARGLMTVGTSVRGEVLADRYRLEEHINDDARGRSVWRGIDIVLRRPVAVVMRHPGGPSAEEMMTAAVASSRIVHPHLVDVYDAIDEGTRAYVIREWVDGTSLRELVAEGPIDTARATTVAHAVASAIAAAHEVGMVHGNVHPGTVLFADDGRVVLADARAGSDATPESDIRAVGAVLYCALTGHWPHAEAGADRLPDAVRTAQGTLASPRQVRGGLPSYLSEMATDLLNADVPPPPADALAAELARLDADHNDEFFGEVGGLGFGAQAAADPHEHRRPSARKIVLGVTFLVVISAAALVVATKLTGASAGKPHAQSTPTASAAATTGQQDPIKPIQLQLGPGQVRIVDPPRGNRTEVDGVEKAVDGDESTGWRTDNYKQPRFGNLKPGMGVLIDLGAAVDVVNVKVDFDVPGATVQVMTGDRDPGATSAGDKQLLKDFKPDGDPRVGGASTVLGVGQKTRYLLVFITSLPPTESGSGYQVAIDEISVFRK
jgi:tRNA A-37 threonylcarbamoyl transferase component Bud32